MNESKSQFDSHETLRRLSIDKGRRPKASRGPRALLIVIFFMVLGTASAAALWYWRTTGADIMTVMAEKAVPVQLYRVPTTKPAIQEQVVLVANGRIVSDVRVNVATKVSGQITKCHVEQGDKVEAGDILAEIEDVVYRAERDRAKATVSRLEHTLARAASNHRSQLAAIDEAKADLSWRVYNHQRLLNLHGDASVSHVELVEAEHLRDASQASLSKAEAAADVTKTGIQVIQSELAASSAELRIHEKRLEDCLIRAPISGVILERNAQVGDFLAAEGGRGANANAQLVSIADMMRLRVEIDVSERDLHRVFDGQRARITADALKDVVHAGHVLWIDPIGDYARAIVQVKVRIDQPSPLLRVDASAKVELLSATAESGDTEIRVAQFSESKSGTWIPLDSIKIEGGAGSVFTIMDNRAVANPVETGSRSLKSIEVTRGIYPGMKIIMNDLDKILDGTLVQIQPSSP